MNVSRPDNWEAMTHRERKLWHRDHGSNRVGFFGVVQASRGRFVAKVWTGQIELFSKPCATAEEAARLHDLIERLAFGDEAVLNFPGEGQS